MSTTLPPLGGDPAAQMILAQRARALARRAEQTEEAAIEDVVLFQLGEAGYALPAVSIREVAVFADLTPLPSTPPGVLGLVNVRGRLLAALDLRPLLGLPQLPAPPGALLLLVSAGGVEAGLLADTVLGVGRGDAALTPPLISGGRAAIPWVRGVDRTLNLVLDPAGLLADPRFGFAV